MSTERTTYRLDELCEFINGFAFKSTDYVEKSSETWEVLRMGYISRGGGFKEDSTPVFVPKSYKKNISKFLIKPDDIVIAMTDMKNNVAILGHTARILDADRFVLNQRVGCIRVNRRDLVDAEYLYYYTNWKNHVEDLRSKANSGVQVNLSTTAIKEAEITLPSLHEQVECGKLLSALDKRISLLALENEKLEAISLAIYKSWFVNFDPVKIDKSDRGIAEDSFPNSFSDLNGARLPTGWSMKTLGDVSDVSIGKTPPRKEQEWFSLNPKDVRWASIRDMGDYKVFAKQTSEYLTKEAIEKFNVRLVPDNTTIMSFKMTIGRVAITDGVMATNEAIAHFKIANNAAVTSEYIYLHLKNFDFSSLSSTSSIADAVNSKTVRDIPILVPDQKVMAIFNIYIAPIFSKIKTNTNKINTLKNVRNTLIPRLMSGQTCFTVN